MERLLLTLILANASGLAAEEIGPPAPRPPRPPNLEESGPRREVLRVDVDDQYATVESTVEYDSAHGATPEVHYCFRTWPEAALERVSYSQGGRERVAAVYRMGPPPKPVPLGELLATSSAAPEPQRPEEPKEPEYDGVPRRDRAPDTLTRIGDGYYRLRLFDVLADLPIEIRVTSSQWLRRVDRTVQFEIPAHERAELTARLRDSRGVTDVRSLTHAIDLEQDSGATVARSGQPLRLTSEFILAYDVGHDDDLGIQAHVHRTGDERPFVNVTLALPWPSTHDAISIPALVNARVDVNGRPLEDAYPSELASMDGSFDLRVTGRARGDGPWTIRVRGEWGRDEKVLVHRVAHSGPRRLWVERLWAQGRVEHLLAEEQRQGPSARRKGEIVHLATAHDLVTPYTVFLTIPAEAATARAKDRLTSVAPETPRVSLGALAAIAAKPIAPSTLSALSRASTAGTHPGGGGTGAPRDGIPKTLAPKNRAEFRMSLLRSDGPPAASPEILRVVGAAFGNLRRCYETQLDRVPQLAGKVELEWRIAADGTPRDVRVSVDTVRSDDVAACLAQKLGSLRYPPVATGELGVAFRFLMRPRP